MESLPVKIFSKEDTPRLRYIAGIILGDILGLSWQVITDKRKLGKNHVINYSAENITGSFKITPVTLLFESGVSQQDIVVTEWKGYPVFYLTSSDSDLPFDIFAASFFLVSRYEEYLKFQPDEHGRFRASLSVAFKNGFLGIPVVDHWTKELSKVFLKKFQTIAFKRHEYRTLLTVDTDKPYAYQGTSLLRSIGSLLHDFSSNSGNAGERYRIVAKGEKDPYDVFDYISGTIAKYNTSALFFFPVGDHAKYDKNPSWKNEDYRKLILKYGSRYLTGLYSSYSAAENASLTGVEAVRLKTILGKDISSNRFHFIKLVFPESYRALIKSGITEDYSMGYPDEPGFRAGIARPFNFYDLTRDKETSLRIFPFQIMDETFINNKQTDPESSKVIILKLLNETKKAGGLFVSIWHNTSLLDDDACKGWRDVFEYMLKTQKP
jgi:hypothetical protein